MNYNAIDINQIITMSRKQLNIKNVFLTGLSLFTFILCAGNFCFSNFLHQPMPFTGWFVAGGCCILNAIREVVVFHTNKRQANKQLTTLITLLRKDGIEVSRLKLKKARVGMKEPERVSNDYGIICVTENVTVFEDNAQKLKALKQVRSELDLKLRKPTSKDVVEANYTELIEDPKEAEKLLVLTNFYRK